MKGMRAALCSSFPLEMKGRMMRLKKCVLALIYFLMILACLGIVVFLGRVGGPEENLREENIEESEEKTKIDGQEEETLFQKESEEWNKEETQTGEQPDFFDEKSCKRGYSQTDTEECLTETEEAYSPPRLMMASDLHYISDATHDEGQAFCKMVQEDDGKISMYSDVLLDVLTEEVIAAAPSALVLTGDITLNGEKENHLRLAEKLQKVKDAGILVLVIPGNHDINNQNAAVYFGDEKEPTEYLETGQEFVDIYHEFGYDQAFERDSTSLSYFCELDETHWMLMLDTCQYEDYNHVSGRLRPETLDWIEEYLKQAKEQGIKVLPVGHHNLLSESRLYTTECTMENHQDIIRLFEKYQLPLYVSGHLHAQRIKKHKAEPGVEEDRYGISEIVLSPYSIPPCQYEYLLWKEDGKLEFSTRQADVEGFAAENGSTDENLLCFSQYGTDFVKRIVEGQVKKTIRAIPEELKSEMAGLYGDIYYDYCAGNSMERRERYSTRAGRLWERMNLNNGYMEDMDQMLADTKEGMHDWQEP